MELRVIHGDITDVESDALIVNLFEGVHTPGGGTGSADSALDGLITDLINAGEITGKVLDVALIHTKGKMAPKRVLVVGLGKAEDFDTAVIRKVAAVAVRFLRKKGANSATSILHGAGIGGIDPQDAARAVVEGTILGLYKGDLYKKPDEPESEITEFSIVELDSSKIPNIEEGLRQGRILAEATNAARDMANEPANQMTPIIMAERARAVAEEAGLEYEEFDEERMAAEGMGALLSVASGSAQPPRLIVLRHIAGESLPTLALVGKGLTFDSGGISIKPQDGLDQMKYDMSGGAAVIEAMQAIAKLKPRINVLGVVPASENMPGGRAFRPGDVVKCSSGKTVEIITTDAEGRMILADAITYAVRQGATHIVDIATLTGSCAIALGNDITGVMGNDQVLIEHVLRASEEVGERMWQLPLPKDYREQLKSTIADVKNVGSRYGGALTGGLFIQEFVEDTPWVHLDIAGTAYTSKDSESQANGYMSPGATGAGLRTMVMLAKRLAERSG